MHIPLLHTDTKLLGDGTTESGISVERRCLIGDLDGEGDFIYCLIQERKQERAAPWSKTDRFLLIEPL